MNFSLEVNQGLEWLEQILTEKLFEDYHESNEFVPFLEAFYTLYKCFGETNTLNLEFKKVVKEDVFWNSTSFWDVPFLLYYAARMDLISHPKFLTLVGGLLKQTQNLEGYIKINEYDHTGAMRILILLEPKSRISQKAVEFFVLNKEVFIERSDNSAGFYFDTIPTGLMALHELDSEKYSSTIKELCTSIKERLSDEGFIEVLDLPHRSYKEDVFKNTALALLALQKVLGTDDEHVQKATTWLKSQQLSNGSWNDSILDTSKVIRALSSIETTH
ncbi:MAG: hypothetical protein ACXACU_00850 [Candidatus Hodarchaeales archaeon]